MADSAGGDKLAVAGVVGANVALIDHWNDGCARDEIRKGGWEWIVLQQGPSSTTVNRDTLRLATRLFAEEAARIGAKVMVFSAWPAAERRQDFDRAIESYTLAAQDVSGTLLPVAAAWLAAWRRDSTLALYSDGLHPSAQGAYVSALVIYSTLLDRPIAGLPATLRLRSGGTLQIVAPRAQLLREAAAEVLRR